MVLLSEAPVLRGGSAHLCFACEHAEVVERVLLIAVNAGAIVAPMDSIICVCDVKYPPVVFLLSYFVVQHLLEIRLRQAAWSAVPTVNPCFPCFWLDAKKQSFGTVVKWSLTLDVKTWCLVGAD